MCFLHLVPRERWPYRLSLGNNLLVIQKIVKGCHHADTRRQWTQRCVGRFRWMIQKPRGYDEFWLLDRYIYRCVWHHLGQDKVRMVSWRSLYVQDKQNFHAQSFNSCLVPAVVIGIILGPIAAKFIDASKFGGGFKGQQDDITLVSVSSLWASSTDSATRECLVWSLEFNSWWQAFNFQPSIYRRSCGLCLSFWSRSWPSCGCSPRDVCSLRFPTWR